MEEEGGARRGRPARPVEGGRRRGRRSEEGPASGEWRGRTEEEAGTESSKEEEVTASGADGGAATGARGADAWMRGATAGGARRR